MRKAATNMDYEKFNKIIDDFIKNDEYKKIFGDLYTILFPICKSVIKENNYQSVTSNKFSIDYNLNDKLKLISKFLKEIDLGLYNQFETIISSLDENNKPLVNFKYSTKEQSSYVDVLDGKIYINLYNNLNDIFIIIHEIIHCMNNYTIKIFVNNYLFFSCSILNIYFFRSYLVIASIMSNGFTSS